MTSEESAKILLNYRDAYCDEGSKNYKALTNAVEALRNTCEDTISRQAVLNYIYNDLGLGDEENGKGAYRHMELEDSYRYVKSLKPVTLQPKTGHWIRWYEKEETELGTEMIPHCKCSECSKEYDSYSSQFIKYCNECGAMMQEVNR